jgi:hypothetical protein
VTAGEGLRPGDAAALLVGPLVPDDYTAAVERTFERVVRLVVIGNLDGEALLRGVQRRALGDRPRAHHAIHLQPQVEMVRGRRVLLHDKHPRAHAANRELLVTFYGDLLDLELDLRTPRPRRRLAEERDELLDRRRVALGMNLQTAVVVLAHPPHQSELACPAHDRVAELRSLHGVVNDGTDRLGVAARQAPILTRPRPSRISPASSISHSSGPEPVWKLVGGACVDPDRGHHRLVIDPAADNEPAIRCHAAVGFRPVGIMRRYEHDADGTGWHDGLLMDLLAEDLRQPE